MKTTETRKPKRAHSVSWQPCSCGCGHFYFELYEPNGRVFAEAWLDRADLLRAAESLRDAAEQPVAINVSH